MLNISDNNKPKKLLELKSNTLTNRRKRKNAYKDDLSSCVINELANIAFCNASDYSRIVKAQDGKGVALSYIPTDELNDRARSSIISIRDTKEGIRIETADKFRALELLGKHLGLFCDKSESTMQVNISDDDRELLKRVDNRNARDN